MAVATTPLPVGNQSNLEKIESFLNDSAYREALESSSNYNTRLCLERKMRMPFLDSQTGVAQNHSALFMSKRQRIPGLNPGQIYSYPRARWRKKRRQYLTLHSRVLARAADSMLDGESDLHSISQVENPALQDTDSKDSQLLKDEVAKEWFYDDQDMLEMEGYDEPDADSDFDYEESSYSKRKSKGRKNAAKSRTVDVPTTPARRGKGGGRGRKKANHSFDPVPGDSDKPFACELCGARYKTRPGLTYHYGHSHRDGASDDSRESVPSSSAGASGGGGVSLAGQPVAAGGANSGGVTFAGQPVVAGAGGVSFAGQSVAAGGMGGGGIMSGTTGTGAQQATPLAAAGSAPGPFAGPGVAPELAQAPSNQAGQLSGLPVYQDSYVTFLNHPAGTPGRRGRQPANANQTPPANQGPPNVLSGPLPPPQIGPQAQQPPALPPPNLPTQPVAPAAPEDPPMPVLLPEKKIPGPPMPPTPGSSTRPPSDLPANLERPPEPHADRPKAAPSPYCDFCLGNERENKKTGTSEELVSCSDCGRSGKTQTIEVVEKVPSKRGRKKKIVPVS